MNKKKLIKLYEIMLRERLFFNEEVRQSNRGYIKGYLHCYNGEEAIAAGVCLDLDSNDSVFSTHRPEGHLVAMGADFGKIMAESFGRVDGCIYGLGGTMHMSFPEKGIILTNGIVGGGIGLAVGAALAHKYKKDRRVAVTFFGDGASNQGVLYEGINLASIWELPVIFVLEDNMYASSSPSSQMISTKNVSDRANAFNIPGYTVNGNNVLEIYSVARKAIKRARDGKGPTFIECKTCRTRGHNEGDPQWYYRTKKEVEEWQENRCPIKFLKDYLIEQKIWDEEEDEALRNNIQKEIDRAVEYAKQSPEPPLENIDKYVWKEV